MASPKYVKRNLSPAYPDYLQDMEPRNLTKKDYSIFAWYGLTVSLLLALIFAALASLWGA
jgi:hypothetical protein